MTRARPLLLLLLILALAACQPKPTAPARWSSADLRALEAPEDGDPALDLVAAYARLTSTDLELRVDFLGSPGRYEYDLYAVLAAGSPPTETGRLPLDIQPDLDWQVAVDLPARGAPRAFDRAGKPLELRPRIQRDAELDAATLRLSRDELAQLLPGGASEVSFQVFVTRPGEIHALDATPALRVDGPAVRASAPLLLAFWDSLPADTPAQALRRWDGAHTGPYGQRHGLRVLLDAAEATGTPLALLDLARPERLSALESLGGLARVQRMAKDGLLMLPEVSSSSPRLAGLSRADSRAAAKGFGLPESALLYGAVDTPGASRAAFARLESADHLLEWEGLKLIPLPAEEDDEQAGPEGLSTPLRARLLRAALAGDPAGLVVLGGALPRSAWGDLLTAGPSLRFIAGHPWMHAVNAQALLDLPALAGQPDCPDLVCLPGQGPPWPENLEGLEGGQGVFARQARQTALRLSEPTVDPRLSELRARYRGQVDVLLRASQWERQPAIQSECAVDLTGDGVPECVLSTEQVLLILDPRGGRLALAAARVGADVVQVIGPRSQFALGLGDPLEWQPERGLLADPQEIAGAFADPGPEWVVYTAEVMPGEVIFSEPVTGMVKRFSLTAGGWTVTLQGVSAGAVLIPLALLDDQAYQAGWLGRYRALPAGEARSFGWDLQKGAQIRVTAQGADLTAHHFAESRAALLEPEDPNAEYPPGHFIPFPLAVVEVQAAGDVSVIFEVGE